MQPINIHAGPAPELSDEIRQCAAQIAAVADLLTRAADIPVETASNAGWLMRGLAERIEACLDTEL